MECVFEDGYDSQDSYEREELQTFLYSQIYHAASSHSTPLTKLLYRHTDGSGGAENENPETDKEVGNKFVGKRTRGDTVTPKAVKRRRLKISPKRDVKRERSTVEVVNLVDSDCGLSEPSEDRKVKNGFIQVESDDEIVELLSVSDSFVLNGVALNRSSPSMLSDSDSDLPIVINRASPDTDSDDDRLPFWATVDGIKRSGDERISYQNGSMVSVSDSDLFSSEQVPDHWLSDTSEFSDVDARTDIPSKFTFNSSPGDSSKIKLADIINTLPDHGWDDSVLLADRKAGIFGKSRKRYYDTRCDNCYQLGHYKSICRLPAKMKVCIYCSEPHPTCQTAEIDTKTRHKLTCPHRQCLHCSRAHLSSRCPHRLNARQKRCRRCAQPGHTSSRCHEVWRQWYSTCDPSLTSPSPSHTPNFSKRKMCSLCAAPGHFHFECTEARKVAEAVIWRPNITRFDSHSMLARYENDAAADRSQPEDQFHRAKPEWRNKTRKYRRSKSPTFNEQSHTWRKQKRHISRNTPPTKQNFRRTTAGPDYTGRRQNLKFTDKNFSQSKTKRFRKNKRMRS